MLSSTDLLLTYFKAWLVEYLAGNPEVMSSSPASTIISITFTIYHRNGVYIYRDNKKLPTTR